MLLVLCAASGAQAGKLDCAVLSDLVRQHTVTRLTGFTGQQTRPLSPALADQAQLQNCARTAQSVSRGFAAAMAQFGMPVRWSYRNRSGVCRAQTIAQCFPFADPAAAPLTIRQINFMSTTWRGLRESVIAHMPWGASGNLIYFTPDSFSRSLSASGLISPKVPPARTNN